MYVGLYVCMYLVDPSGRVVYGVCLLPLTCWDYVFESRKACGCLPLVNVEVSGSG